MEVLGDPIVPGTAWGEVRSPGYGGRWALTDMLDSRRLDRECSRSVPPPPCTPDCRSFVSVPLRAVFPRPEGPRLTALGGRHCQSTGLRALDGCRSGAEHFPGGQAWGYICI